MKIASWAFAVHRPWIWIKMVWAFSTDIVYFRFASPQATKTGVLHCFGMSCHVRSAVWSRVIATCPSSPCMHCLWYSPMCYVYHTLDAPNLARRLITYVVNYWFLTSIHHYLPRLSYFWKGELSRKFTCHYLVAATSFEYVLIDLKKAFRKKNYRLFWCHNFTFSFPKFDFMIV